MAQGAQENKIARQKSGNFLARDWKKPLIRHSLWLPAKTAGAGEVCGGPMPVRIPVTAKSFPVGSLAVEELIVPSEQSVPSLLLLPACLFLPEIHPAEIIFASLFLRYL
jgi:hypothetical protein